MRIPSQFTVKIVLLPSALPSKYTAAFSGNVRGKSLYLYPVKLEESEDPSLSINLNNRSQL